MRRHSCHQNCTKTLVISTMCSSSPVLIIFALVSVARIRPGAGFVSNLAHRGIVRHGASTSSSLAATRINPTWNMNSVPNNTAWDIPNYDKAERPTKWVDVDFEYDNPPTKQKADPKATTEADDLDVDLIDPELVDVIAPSSYETNNYKSSFNMDGRVSNGPFAGQSGSQAGYVPPFAHSRKGYANTKTSPNKADAKIDWNDLADKMADAKKDLEDFMSSTKKDSGSPFTSSTRTEPKVGVRPRNGRSKASPNIPDVQNWHPAPPEMGGPSVDLKDPSPNKADVQSWRPPPPDKGGPQVEDLNTDFVDLSKGPFTSKSGSQAGSTPSCAFKREKQVQWDVPPGKNGHSTRADRDVPPPAAVNNKNNAPQATPRTTANAADVRIHLEIPTVNAHKPQDQRKNPHVSIPCPPPVDTFVPPVADASASLGAEAAARADWNTSPAQTVKKQHVSNTQGDFYAPSGESQQQVDRRASSANKPDVKANWNPPTPVKKEEKNAHFQWEEPTINMNEQNVEPEVPYYESEEIPLDNFVEEDFAPVGESGNERLNMIDRLFGMRNRAQEPPQQAMPPPPPPPPPSPASMDRPSYALPHEIAMAKNWLSERMGCVADAHQEAYAKKLTEYGCECIDLLEMLVNESDMERILKDVIGMKPFHFIMLIKGLNGEFRYQRRSPFVGRSLWRHVSHRDEYTEVFSWLKANMRGVPESYLPGYASKLVDFGCDSVELIEAMFEDQYIDTVQVLEGTIGMKPFHCKLLFQGLMGG